MSVGSISCMSASQLDADSPPNTFWWIIKAHALTGSTVRACKHVDKHWFCKLFLCLWVCVRSSVHRLC